MQEPSQPTPTAKLAKPVVVLTATAVASLFLALLRDILIADWFGASVVSDVFFLALVIPTLFENLIGISIKDALIPVLTTAKQRGRAGLLALARDLQGAVFIVALGVTLACWVFAEPLLAGLAPGLTPDALDQAARAFRIVAPIILVNALIYFDAAILNIYDEFLIPSLRAVLLNVGIISGGMLWRQAFGGAEALSLGLVLGLLVQLGLQWAADRRRGVTCVPHVAFSALRVLAPALLVFVPVFVSALTIQINVLVDRVLASGLGEGSIAALSFAFRVATLPINVIALSIVTVVFPKLAGHHSEGDTARVVSLSERTLKNVLLVMLPASAGLMLLSQPLIALVLEHGAFTATATQLTAAAMFYYSIGLLPYAGMLVLSRSFYALREMWTPAKISVATMILNIGLAITLSRVMGLAGLALANALSFWFNFGALFVLYWKYLRVEQRTRLLIYTAQVGLATVTMLGVLLGCRYGLEHGWLHPSPMIALSGQIAVGAASFGVAALGLQIEDVTALATRILRGFYTRVTRN